MKNICLIYAIVCFGLVSFCEAVEISERKVTTSDGTAFEVTEVTDDDTDIVILKKDGKIYEQQITHVDKGYVITKINNTCNIEFPEVNKMDKNNTCYSGRTPSEEEITEDMKADCGNLEVRFVYPVNCSKENHVEKRFISLCITVCYYRYTCYCVWLNRPVCYVYQVCYKVCLNG